MTQTSAQGNGKRTTSRWPGDGRGVTRRQLVVGGAGAAGAGLVGLVSAGSASAAGRVPAFAAAASTPWAKLRRGLTGTLYQPSTKGYAGVAHGTNPRYDTINPKAVARCVSAADVAACVAFAQTYAVPFTVRSGGHAASGWSTDTAWSSTRP